MGVAFFGSPRAKKVRRRFHKELSTYNLRKTTESIQSQIFSIKRSPGAKKVHSRFRKDFYESWSYQSALE